MRRLTLTIGVLALASWAPAVGQIPETFTNLQVLPAEIERRALIDVMRGFARGLGVRCQFCHVGEEVETLADFDFASDDKEHKRVARAMLRMTQAINRELLPATGRDDLMVVECATCHRGLAEPHPLDHLLVETVQSEGVEAARARWAELEAEHSGRGRYDFGPRTLGWAAEALALRHDNPDGALGLAQFNVELHPDDVRARVELGQLRARAGDTAGALEEMRAALALDPENAWIRGQIERLEAPPEPAPEAQAEPAAGEGEPEG